MGTFERTDPAKRYRGVVVPEVTRNYHPQGSPIRFDDVPLEPARREFGECWARIMPLRRVRPEGCAD